ncbi:hypothetical protein AAG570_005828 [Ranatra chinensis]|uniref:ARM repeat superfamily protein n=1 Tax=Ranatra chinensis TaxID=642074 RepID=A0ABD0XYX4_9HEMI
MKHCLGFYKYCYKNGSFLLFLRQLCSKALQLTRLVIVSFIPPNLALLVDTLQGSSIGDLGKQLFRRLHDIHWEVRDSSLEVLEAISSLADAKFPAFQSLLIDNDLPRVVVSIATGDSEPYVRASGLAALCQMVKIQHIWDSALYNQKILDNVLKMLQHDTEGLVRHQASLLVTAIYKHQTIPGSFLDRIYDIMYHVAIYDLHWEVKLGALEFWSEVIESAVTQEGMIDGAFPQMTFSRTARKIVTLDPPEIRNRLLRILRHLSIIGCLHVLWKTLNDDCDLEVVKKSVAIVKKLMALLDKYELTRRGTTNSLPKEQSPNIIEAVYHKVLSDEGAEAAPQKHNLPSSPLEQETLANTIQQVNDDLCSLEQYLTALRITVSKCTYS